MLHAFIHIVHPPECTYRSIAIRFYSQDINKKMSGMLLITLCCQVYQYYRPLLSRLPPRTVHIMTNTENQRQRAVDIAGTLQVQKTPSSAKIERATPSHFECRRRTATNTGSPEAVPSHRHTHAADGYEPPLSCCCHTVSPRIEHVEGGRFNRAAQRPEGCISIAHVGGHVGEAPRLLHIYGYRRSGVPSSRPLFQTAACLSSMSQQKAVLPGT